LIPRNQVCARRSPAESNNSNRLDRRDQQRLDLALGHALADHDIRADPLGDPDCELSFSDARLGLSESTAELFPDAARAVAPGFPVKSQRISASCAQVTSSQFDCFGRGVYIPQRNKVSSGAIDEDRSQQHFIFRAESPVIRSSRWTL
jgi:hypothetical protein